MTPTQFREMVAEYGSRYQAADGLTYIRFTMQCNTCQHTYQQSIEDCGHPEHVQRMWEEIACPKCFPDQERRQRVRPPPLLS